ncbi:MAG: hypothetical protein ACFFDW_13010 [Candidatus Thorarchaeota archaeon]
MIQKGKIVFNYEEIKTNLELEEIVSLISTGDRNSPEYGLTLMILRTLLSGEKMLSKDKMYDLYMRNRDNISKASFYRILNKLIDRGMIVFDEDLQRYKPSIFFSNALQKLAVAWETLVLPEK